MKAKCRIITRLFCYTLLWALCAAWFSSAARSDAARQTQSIPQAATTQEQSTTYSLDLIYDPITEPTPVVRVRFGNTGPTYLFEVDTGTATALVIAPWAAKEMGLDTLGKRTLQKPGSDEDDQIDFSKTVTFSLLDAGGNSQWNIAPSAVVVVSGTNWDNHALTLSNHAGTIGMAAFSNVAMQFDFERKKLSLFYPAPASLPLSSSSLIFPLKRNSVDKIRWNAQVTLGSPKNKPVSLLVDTGLTENAFPQELMPHLKPTLTLPVLIYGARGIEFHPYGLLPSILINKQEERNITAVWINASERRHAAVGMNLLSRFRVTIDQKNALLILEKASNHDTLAKLLPSETGLHLVKNATSFYVDKDSPLLIGTDVPLKGGDMVVSVDNTPITNLSIASASRLLNWNAGTDAKLKIKRGDKTFTINVKRRNPFALPAVK